MKRIIAVIISVVLIVTMFIACSKDETVSEIVTDENGEPVTEVVTDENGETVTEVVTDASGETVTEVVTEQVTNEDGTVETVTKTVPVTQAVTQQSTTKRTTTTTKKNTSPSGSSGSMSKETTTKKSTTTAKPTTTTHPSTTKPQTTKPTTTKPTTTAHTHNWVAQTKTETTYKWEQHSICNGCGMDLTTEAKKMGISEAMFHVKHLTGNGVTACSQTLGDGGTAHYEQVKVATGTTTVVTGYKCSTCGATKDA